MSIPYMSNIYKLVLLTYYNKLPEFPMYTIKCGSIFSRVHKLKLFDSFSSITKDNQTSKTVNQ